MAEQWTENPCVAISILALGTNLKSGDQAIEWLRLQTACCKVRSLGRTPVFTEMTEAQQMVAMILDEDGLERVCAQCAKDHNYYPTTPTTHSWCKRHYREMLLQDAGFMGHTPQDVEAKVAAIPDEQFAPDRGPVQ